MPELPEVEVLARHLDPLLRGRTVVDVDIVRPKILLTSSPGALQAALLGARFTRVHRRAKYLLFELETAAGTQCTVLGHLGMTGRMYVQPATAPVPKHAVISMGLGGEIFVFEDTRRFGRFTLDAKCLETLGPEPLEDAFDGARLLAGLRSSRQPVKLRLLDQSVVAGVGNIYASEALFRAGIRPTRRGCRLTLAEAGRLCAAIRSVLGEAVRLGSSLNLDWTGKDAAGGVFYYGAGPGDAVERFMVYDREGLPCVKCGHAIKRIVQAARSSFFCPDCQQ